MCARSSRTDTMRAGALQTLTLLTVLGLVPTARAGWEERTVPGVPRDVQVWDGDRFSVATTEGGYLFVGGVLTRQLPAGGGTPQGTFLTSDGCLVVLDRTWETLSSDCTGTPV